MIRQGPGQNNPEKLTLKQFLKEIRRMNFDQLYWLSKMPRRLSTRRKWMIFEEAIAKCNRKKIEQSTALDEMATELPD